MLKIKFSVKIFEVLHELIELIWKDFLGQNSHCDITKGQMPKGILEVSSNSPDQESYCSKKSEVFCSK